MGKVQFDRGKNQMVQKYSSEFTIIKQSHKKHPRIGTGQDQSHLNFSSSSSIDAHVGCRNEITPNTSSGSSLLFTVYLRVSGLMVTAPLEPSKQAPDSEILIKNGMG
jgi:hypothetical protein